MAATAPAAIQSLGDFFSWDCRNNRTARKKKKAGAMSVFARPERAVKVGFKAQRKRTTAERTGSPRVAPKSRNPRAQPRTQLTALAQTVIESSRSRFQSKIKKWPRSITSPEKGAVFKFMKSNGRAFKAPAKGG